MITTPDLPDPAAVIETLKRHAAAYSYGCFEHHNGIISNPCPYFASDHCSAQSSADALTLIEYLLDHQSTDSALYHAPSTSLSQF